MYKFKKGFTLLEVMVGFFIFSAVALLFFTVVGSSSKESAFSVNHFSAIMVGQKAAEDIMEEYQQNPYADESLALNSSIATKNSLIDGGSVFFMAIEDTRPPWGKIESAKDGGINSTQEPLYSQMKGFTLSTKALSEAPEEFESERENLRQISLCVDWKNSSDQGKTQKTFYVFAPRQSKKLADPLTSLNFSDLGFEDELKALLPSGLDAGKSFAEAISELSPSEKARFQLDAVRIVGKGFAESELVQRMTKEIRLCKEKLGFVKDPESEFRQRLQLAKYCYQLARMSLSVVAATTQLAETSPAEVARLSEEDANEMYLNLKVVYYMFLDSMLAARYYYQSLLGGKMAAITGQKTQQQLIYRLIDIYRILVFAPEHDKGKKEYEGFIARVKEMSAWRNQFLYRFVEQEKKLLEDFPKMLEKFPNLTPVNLALNKQMPKLLEIVEGRASPGNGKNGGGSPDKIFDDNDEEDDNDR